MDFAQGTLSRRP